MQLCSSLSYLFLNIRLILKDEIKSHAFSWAIWSITTSVVFLLQLAGGRGVGAWLINVSGCITIYITILAYVKRADITITKVDRIFFIAAIFSLPL